MIFYNNSNDYKSFIFNKSVLRNLNKNEHMLERGLMVWYRNYHLQHCNGSPSSFTDANGY